MTQPDPTAAEAVQYWYDAAVERREERDQLRAVVARVRQMADAWEQQLPEVIRTPAVVSAIRAALEPAAVAPPADRAAAPTVWIDGHPQLEAIARAVWEQCGTDECAAVTIDDPRNIAVAALGALPATQPPADRTNLRDVAAQAIRDSNGSAEALAWWKAHPQLIPAHVYADAVLAVLPAPDQRAATLLEAADIAESLREFTPAFGARKAAQISENVGVLRVAEKLRRLAGEAQQDPAPGDFQDQGDAARRAAGIDGTAGDAQDIPHAPVLDESTGGCLLCGLAPSYRKHTAVAQPGQPEKSREDDNPPVQCWHTEPDTPCDWDVCRQPERLAVGDRGTDPANKERRP